jgi:hypothetical protein
MLIDHFLTLIEQGWQQAFARKNSFHHAIEQALAYPALFGQRPLSRVICGLGRGVKSVINTSLGSVGPEIR